MLKDTKQDFDQFYGPQDVFEVVAGYEELVEEDARRKKFNSEVGMILAEHIPQVALAVVGGIILSGLIKGVASADGYNGDHRVGLDEFEGDRSHTTIGSSPMQNLDGMQAWIGHNVSLPPIDLENDLNLRTGSNFTLPLLGPEDMASMEYFNSGESGLFLTTTRTTNVNGEVITVFGLGNKVSPSERARMGVDNLLFDLSVESATQSPHFDENGNQDGVDLVRNFTASDIETLKFLLANHSDRKGTATNKMLEDLFESSSNVPIIIRMLEGKTVDGDIEKQLQLVVVRNIGGKMVDDILFQKELRPGEVKMSTVDMSQVKNAVIIQSRTPNGENILVITPAFPEGTDKKIIPWQDSDGKWWGGVKEGDAQLELNDKGIWESTKEIVLNPRQIGFELGETVEGHPDWREVVDIVPAIDMDPKQQDEFEIKMKPETYGFKEGETILVYTLDGKVELRRASNNSDLIATFVDREFVWVPDQLVNDNGEPIVMNAGLVIPVRYRAPVKREVASSAAFAITGGFNKLFNPEGQHFPRHQPYVFIANDGKTGVQVNYTTNDNLPPGVGYLYFRDKDGKTVRYLKVVNFDERLDFVEALH